MTIGDRIKQRRLELGLSVDELAERLGKNRATVYRYESNEIENFPITLMSVLAKALNTSPARLMGWENESEKEWAEESLRATRANAIGALYSGFSDKEVNHFKDFIQLNDSNMDKVDNYTKKLLSVQKMDNDLEVAAAHERTDIEVTDEMRKHDDDIMDDDDF
ncbi:MAG TPA: hypothetical protein DIW07_10885 [Lachnospiraceae bacterium]|jgi:transcriptional regulator with XRE-family HTH domain|uniref:Transcriptional regulator with XRE-family HTH domain n=1 Tax=Muricomes intestini TaxID=1796634 RepID=A0A4R3K6I0_9FIRM|nr:helix-turn-helix transcriptional regulator [Muricomes intestini]TCS78496.1 transcriptional regulator with XRE-family HTH domain [Muricomes intestini]HCR83897.1 hypothetical protein [Lachnospiraceae bacterium]